VHPIVFVVNNSLGATIGHLMSESFNLKALFYYLTKYKQHLFISYAPWRKTILDFCNYLAQRCNIPLGLKALDSEDQGEIIFDFRYNPDAEMVKAEMGKLLKGADLTGCTPY